MSDGLGVTPGLHCEQMQPNTACTQTGLSPEGQRDDWAAVVRVSMGLEPIRPAGEANVGQQKYCMTQENRRMTFDFFAKNAQAIFDSFPNERVWLQGGLRPNRQLQKPEAVYCIVIRYDEKTTSAISHFMTKILSVLPPIVEYSEQNLHTTVGTYGKGNMEGFALDSATLQHLMRSVEKGINNRPRNLRVEFGRWLYNEEAMLISGYPNQDLWCLFQYVKKACQENGYPLEMGRIVHITTARFISGVSRQEFEKFNLLMKSAPTVAPAKPSAIDLATWRCDGLIFDIVTHKRYYL